MGAKAYHAHFGRARTVMRNLNAPAVSCRTHSAQSLVAAVRARDRSGTCWSVRILAICRARIRRCAAADPRQPPSPRPTGPNKNSVVTIRQYCCGHCYCGHMQVRAQWPTMMDQVLTRTDSTSALRCVCPRLAIVCAASPPSLRVYRLPFARCRRRAVVVAGDQGKPQQGCAMGRAGERAAAARNAPLARLGLAVMLSRDARQPPRVKFRRAACRGCCQWVAAAAAAAAAALIVVH